jgi:hypothetical protein
MKKTAKNKVILKKRSSKTPQDKSLGSALSLSTLKQELGDNFNKVIKTGNKMNPFFVESKDGKNNAFGRTEEEALQNLLIGINKRNIK